LQNHRDISDFAYLQGTKKDESFAPGTYTPWLEIFEGKRSGFCSEMLAAARPVF